jgi:hypothetical protein
VTHHILGIDVGRYKVDVGIPPAHNKIPAKQYPTVTIDLRHPGWWQHLIDLIAEGRAVVTLESTGYHLSAPIARLIYTHRPNTSIYEVEGSATGAFRKLYTSKNAKTDRLDAISLYLIAVALADGQELKGTKPYDHARSLAIATLRLHYNAYHRAERDRVRLQNRLTVMSRSIAPVADQMFLSFSLALRSGLKSLLDFQRYSQTPPRQRKALTPNATPGERTAISRLVNKMPPIPFDETTIDIMIDLLDQWDKTQDIKQHHKAHLTAIVTAPPLSHITHRWQTMPGWNIQWIAALHVATHGEADRITKDQFRAAVGVAPATAITGESDKTRLIKKGYRPARKAMFLWTLGLLSPTAKPNSVRSYFESSTNRSIGAAKNKLARVLWGRANDASLDICPIEEPEPEKPAPTLIDEETGEILD